MKIIDSHVHLFPEKIAAAAVKATGEFYAGARADYVSVPDHIEPLPGTAEDLLERNARAGVARSVVFSTATRPHQVESVNTFIAALCAEHPEFIGVGTMHVDYPDFDRELLRIRELGLRGVKLHPDIQRFDLDDERLLPMYDRMRAEGLFLIAHTGDYRYGYSSPRRMARLAKLFPEMRFIGAHFGGWSQWEEARETLCLPNVYVDTSSTIGYGGAAAARLAFAAFDPAHIFFGSDYPMCDPGEELERLRSLGLPEDILENVLGKNLERFLADG